LELHLASLSNPTVAELLLLGLSQLDAMTGVDVPSEDLVARAQSVVEALFPPGE